MRRLSDRVEKETASVEAFEGLALMIPAEIVKAPYTPFSVSLPTTSPIRYYVITMLKKRCASLADAL